MVRRHPSRRELLLEVTRLNSMQQKYYGRAMDDDGEGSTAAGLLFTKLSERKATLIGLNAPASASVQIIHQGAPAWEQTSTEKIRSALDNVMGVTARERELEDKQLYSHEKLSVDEQAELDGLRAGREAKRIAKLGRNPGSEPSTKPH